MPEIKRLFQAGKMNQDSDERLIPNGEYRDALNIEVGTSEGSNVGAVESVSGNSRVTTIGIAGQKCIGTYVDYINNKIYWFLTGTTVDAIAEYDPSTDTVSPILVDKLGVMNFSTKWRITGVNMINGLLYFTDGLNEPKMINIAKFKLGTTDFANHTELVGQNGTSVDFTEEDVTVIKKAPLTPPTLSLLASKRSGVVETTYTQSTISFTETVSGEIVPKQTTTAPFDITVDSTPNWQVGDQLLVTADGGVFSESTARLKVTKIYPASPSVFEVAFDSISEDIEQGAGLSWVITLVEEKAMFEFKFPRFAYRWKFKDYQHSPIGPWSEPAFLPDEYDYQAKKGYNLGMKNTVRSLTVTDFVVADMPKDVVEIDILYKEDGVNNIYTVKSIKAESGSQDEEYTANALVITSEIIYATVPSNQILRPYDNVPKTAKSQELTSNRLVYGNFVHQYDLIDSNGGDITPKFDVAIVQDVGNAVVNGTPKPSLKSLRTYQVGVVYRDKYGRETPVLTDPSGSVVLSKAAADKYNTLIVNITSPAPAFAESYKYFIKETSNEYYNLAMDRHYKAEDGNTWISFPSSERNKIQEDDFVILKKGQGGTTLVTEEAKYKILAIENQAPDYLKLDHVSQGLIEGGASNLFNNEGYPSTGFVHLTIGADKWETAYGSADPDATNNNINMSLHTKSDLLVQVRSATRATDRYEVAAIQYIPAVGAGVASYKVTIEKVFKAEDCDWLGLISAGTQITSYLTVEFYQKKVKRKPEFQGRFFAKLNQDSALTNAVLSKANEEDYKILQSLSVWQQETNLITRAYWRNTPKGTTLTSAKSGWYIDKTRLWSWADAGGTGDARDGVAYHKGIGVESGSRKIEISYHWWGENDGDAWQDAWVDFEGVHKTQYKSTVRALQTPGSKFTFPDDTVNKTVYTIKKWRRNHGVAFPSAVGYKKGRLGSQRIIRWTLDLDKDIIWAPEDNTTNFGVNADYRTEINILQPHLLDDNPSDGGNYSASPGIFETEPKEDIGMELYFEASKAYGKALHGQSQTLSYFNCYSFGNGVESNRIRDDFNAKTIAKGVKASTTLDAKYEEESRKNSLIFSGLYNDNSNTNQLNQFIMAEAITKELDPSYGSIQKLHARDTNLIVLCEDKVLKVLADKDALYNADGSANVLSANRFLGQATPYVGEYGISNQPESFATHGYQAYFTDKARGVVIRLSQDGITPISDHGMKDYFSDNLVTDKLDHMIGSYDNRKRLYNITILDSSVATDFSLDTGNRTLSFMEASRGWTSRKSFIPEAGCSLDNKYYTFKDGDMWLHGSDVNATFYGVFQEPSIKFIFNDSPETVKTFKTLNYEGTQSKIVQNLTDGRYDNNAALTGWYNVATTTNLQSGKVNEFIKKEGKWFNFIQGDATVLANVDTQEFAVQGVGQFASFTDTGSAEFVLTIN
jgi:hypothetical protein